MKHSVCKQPPLWTWYIACPEKKKNIMCHVPVRRKSYNPKPLAAGFSACRFTATVRVTHGSWMIFLLKLQLLENPPHGRSWKSSTFWGIQNSQRSWMKGRSAGMIINNDGNIIICIVCSVQLLYMYINDIVKMEEVLNQTLSIYQLA